ncbi:hypothetical protein [Porphyromonas pogonae]|uniref:hypothetical protein n=1 Tax=Porphyromonas pogonae TaxID=867595 RepID=UPI002E7635A5|nr:hypothetical protein [Porphyromonas pogonae]
MKLNLGTKKTRANNERSNAEDVKKRKKASSLLTFFVFVLISSIFWVLQSLQGDYKKKIVIPLQYDSLPGRLGIELTPPGYVEVQVIDKGVNLVEYTFSHFIPIQLRVIKEADGLSLGITRKDLLNEVTKKLDPSARIISLSPSDVNIPIFTRRKKKVPVKVGYIPPASQGYIISNTGITPDSLVIYGSQNTLSKIDAVYTDSIKGKSLSSALYKTIGVNSPVPGVVFERQSVQLKVNVEELTQASFELPLLVLDLPSGKVLRPLPGRINLLVTVPLSRYNDLNSEDFTVGVRYPNIDSVGVDASLPVEIIQKPKWVTHINLQPERVQYVVENR